jgi:ketosteroid isomerase-like protein
MRISFSSLAALMVGMCLVVGIVPRSAAQEDDAARVRSLEAKWTDSYKQRKIDILASLLAEDFVITVEDGNTYSKSGYITHTADDSVQVKVAELSDLKVHLHGNAAVVTGAYHEKGISNGKPYEYHDRLTDVWLKKEGNWQVIASHYSVPVK